MVRRPRGGGPAALEGAGPGAPVPVPLLRRPRRDRPLGHRWTRGRYDLAELERLYTGHHSRAARILQEVKARVADPARMRALGFLRGCGPRGLHGAPLRRGRRGRRGDSRRHAGRRAPERPSGDLRERRVQRGLRRRSLQRGRGPARGRHGPLPAPDGERHGLPPAAGARAPAGRRARGRFSVLDFIGNAHRQFRFDLKYRAILGGTRRDFAKQVEAEFPFLPPGLLPATRPSVPARPCWPT